MSRLKKKHGARKLEPHSYILSISSVECEEYIITMEEMLCKAGVIEHKNKWIYNLFGYDRNQFNISMFIYLNFITVFYEWLIRQNILHDRPTSNVYHLFFLDENL